MRAFTPTQEENFHSDVDRERERESLHMEVGRRFTLTLGLHSRLFGRQTSHPVQRRFRTVPRRSSAKFGGPPVWALSAVRNGQPVFWLSLSYRPVNGFLSLKYRPVSGLSVCELSASYWFCLSVNYHWFVCLSTIRQSCFFQWFSVS